MTEAGSDEGHDVAHVRERNLLGIPDHEALNRAFEEDHVLVTANVGDFWKLAGAREIHAGIILILDGGLRRDEQREVLRRVLAALTAEGELVNRALTIGMDGGLSIEELPP